MNKLNKYYIIFFLIFFSQLNNCQEVINNIQETTVKPKPKQTTRIYYGTTNKINAKTIPVIKTTGYFTTTRTTFATSVIGGNINSNTSEVISGAETNGNSTVFKNSTINENEFIKKANWTSGFGTHYGNYY